MSEALPIVMQLSLQSLVRELSALRAAGSLSDPAVSRATISVSRAAILLYRAAASTARHRQEATSMAERALADARAAVAEAIRTETQPAHAMSLAPISKPRRLRRGAAGTTRAAAP